MRLIASLGHYFASKTADRIQIHQYGSAQIVTSIENHNLELEMRSDYPWNGDIDIDIRQCPETPWSLQLRIPGWVDPSKVRMAINDQYQQFSIKAGKYLDIKRKWQVGDILQLSLPMDVRLVTPHPRIDSVRGCIAIERGPIVYCVEGCDLPGGIQLSDIRVPEDVIPQVEWREDLFGGANILKFQAKLASTEDWTSCLYKDIDQQKFEFQNLSVIAIPYYAWANRDQGQMRVWLPQL